MKKSYFVSAALAAVLFSGCGGGSSSSGTTTSSTQTGTFADAPVQGLSYKTATQSGFTDAQGQFKYKDGETVEFKLGTLFLGKGKAGALVTPYTIAGNNTTAINIALVLQNFDANRSNSQVLDLSKLKDYNFTSDDINITAAPSALQTKLSTLLSTGSFQTKVDDTNYTLLTETEVKTNMDDYIHKYETEHSKVTTPTKAEIINKNTVPYTVTYDNKLNGQRVIDKMGATGKIEAVYSNDYYYGKHPVELQFTNNNNAIDLLVNTIKSTRYQTAHFDNYGYVNVTTENDFIQGTAKETIVDPTHGTVTCTNYYSPLSTPYTLYDPEMQFQDENLQSTDCPTWLNSLPSGTLITSESTENFTIIDTNNETSKVSVYHSYTF